MYVRFFDASTPIAAGRLWGDVCNDVFRFANCRRSRLLSKRENYPLLSLPTLWIRENNWNSIDGWRSRVTILPSQCLKSGMPRIAARLEIG